MLHKISARHTEIDDAIRLRAEAVMARLAGFAPQAVEGTVIFDVVAAGEWAEIKIHLPGGQTLVATATEIDHRTALDRAESKMRKQIERAATAARRDRRASRQP
ncbi:MAG: HPF/RaiA family ribosome-associated protein [Gemmatimonadales bacterium]